MAEINDPTLNKDLADITELQMQILRMAYTPDELEFVLQYRYWTVVPQLFGLSEAQAIELLKVAGFEPEVYYQDGGLDCVDYGEVFFQYAPAGCLIVAGEPFPLGVRKEGAEPFPTTVLPDDMSPYMPTFLNNTYEPLVTVNRDTGMSLPVQASAGRL